MSGLAGNEVLFVQGVAENGQLSAQTFQTTTGAIAALASDESTFSPTSVTATSGTTLTAAALISGEITRSGPSANFSDTTASAAQIIASLPGGLAAGGYFTYIKNTTAYTQTILAGGSVTLPTTFIVPPFSNALYFVYPTSGTAVTFLHVFTAAISTGAVYTSPSITSLATTGATGTITYPSFVSGITARTGPTQAFTDTTDTAANIIAASASLVGKIGTSFIYYYANNTNYVATLTGGMGVTVSGITTVPPNTIAAYLISYTAAATLTMVGLGVTETVGTTVTIAGSSSGATVLQAASAASGTLTLPAVTDTVAVLGTAQTFTATQTLPSPVITGIEKLSVSATVSAAGTNLATATVLSAAINDVTTVASSTGVALPANAVGQVVVVYANGANNLKVYPDAAGSAIDGGTSGAAVTLTSTRRCQFTVISSGQWISAQLGAVSS